MLHSVHANKRIKMPQNEELEEAVLKWYVQQYSVKVEMMGVEILDTLTKLTDHMHIPFKGSDGWLWRFRRHCGHITGWSMVRLAVPH